MNLVPGLIAWRVNTGALKNKHGRPVKFSRPGAADISGIVGPEGWRIEIEVKRDERAARTELSPAQARWRDMVLRAGGIYFLTWDAQALLRAVLAELARRRAP